MLRQVLHQLRPLLRRPVLDLLLIAAVGVAAGGVEAAVLVLVVKGALAIAAGTSEVPFDVPIFHVQVSTGTMLVGAACLAIALPLLNATLSKLIANVGTEVLTSARHRAAATFLGASWEKQSTEREGAVQETVTTFAFQASTLTLAVSGIVSGALSLAALLIVAVVVDVVVTAFVLAFGLLLFVLIRPLSRLTARRSTKYVRANSRYTEDVARMAVMSMELRVFGAEPAMLESLDESSADVSQHLRRTRFAARVGATVYRDVAVLFLVLAVGALNILGGDRLGEIGAVALLVVRSLGYATAVQTALQQVSEFSPSLNALYERFDELRGARVRWGSKQVTSFETIELDGVTYSYDERTPALRDVDLTIAAGEVLGIVGPSGSGKSTLLQVLLRLRTPVEGAVTVDGVDYVDIDPRSWSSMVALVPQEPRLIAASVADNIAFLRPWVTRSEIERAADAAHVGAEIRALPNGFDTVLGPHGTGLSGGQKQRVAFARALVGRPRLLILDEPTSALDGVSERRIQETIAELRGEVTLVIVAHRLSALDVCNRVISIRNGRIEPAELPEVVVSDEASA